MAAGSEGSEVQGGERVEERGGAEGASPILVSCVVSSFI